MEDPRSIPEPVTLSPSSSGRKSNDSNSPEFEFWMLRNPSFPQPNLLTADQLFADGVLLPLNFRPSNPNPPPVPDPHTPDPDPGPELLSPPVLTASKRWTDIFKIGEKKTGSDEKEKEKKVKKKSNGGGGGGGAELNINLWPFSRSRSAGNNGVRPRMVAGAPATRKVSSAPCSRSNSAGESKSRKWPSSPGRIGVHVGRASPVWQIRRGGSALRSTTEKVVRKDGTETRGSSAPAAVNGGRGGRVAPKARVLNLHVPMCIGYRQHMGCRSDANSAAGGGAAGSGCAQGGGGDGGSGNVGSGGNLFNLRSLFTKKVY